MRVVLGIWDRFDKDGSWFGFFFENVHIILAILVCLLRSVNSGDSASTQLMQDSPWWRDSSILWSCLWRPLHEVHCAYLVRSYLAASGVCGQGRDCHVWFSVSCVIGYLPSFSSLFSKALNITSWNPDAWNATWEGDRASLKFQATCFSCKRV